MKFLIQFIKSIPKGGIVVVTRGENNRYINMNMHKRPLWVMFHVSYIIPYVSFIMTLIEWNIIPKDHLGTKPNQTFTHHQIRVTSIFIILNVSSPMSDITCVLHHVRPRKITKFFISDKVIITYTENSHSCPEWIIHSRQNYGIVFVTW